MGLSFEDWFKANIQGNGHFTGYPDKWEYLFPVLCWLLWKRRCSLIMDSNFIEHGDMLVQGQRMVEECHSTAAGRGVAGSGVAGRNMAAGRGVVGRSDAASNALTCCREGLDQGWSAPRQGWIKANADGASALGSCKATAGGVLRDENGAWIFGFARKLGVCSSLIAEIWAVHNYLLHAWRLGFRMVELETDCLEVERILLGKSKVLPGNAIVADIREMFDRNWVVKISRVSRNSNKVADALAISIRDDPVGVRFFDLVPLFVSKLVYEDVNGRSNKINHQSTPPSLWTPPNNGFVKINCDASFSLNPPVAAVAAILRDSDGRIVGGEASKIQARSIDVAEALAIRLGVETAAKAGLTHILVESDNLNLVNHIVDHSFWETMTIEKDILALSLKFSSCYFSFISRKCNQAAHWVAKNFRSSACPRDWPTNVPHGLRRLL
ncbi:hypothetical protein GQ457_05G009730 [Hibiscus cannabinus]